MVMVCMCVLTDGDGDGMCVLTDGDGMCVVIGCGTINGLHMVFVVAITLHILPNKVTGVSAIV